MLEVIFREVSVVSNSQESKQENSWKKKGYIRGKFGRNFENFEKKSFMLQLFWPKRLCCDCVKRQCSWTLPNPTLRWVQESWKPYESISCTMTDLELSQERAAVTVEGHLQSTGSTCTDLSLSAWCNEKQWLVSLCREVKGYRAEGKLFWELLTTFLTVSNKKFLF